MKLTKRAIDAAKYSGDGKSRCVVWDAAMPGFGLRIYPGGRKAFVLSYRPAGTRAKRMMTIGQYGALTLDQARKKARKEQARIHDGADPLHERQTARVELNTFGELVDRWLEEYAKPHRKSWREDERRINTHLKKFRNRLVTKVSDADLRALHVRIGEKAPVEANRVVELVRAIYRQAAEWKAVPSTFENPASGIKRFQEKSRERWLTAREVQRFAVAVNREDDPWSRAALLLLLLTGCRKTELLRARWDRLDIAGKRLQLEDTKTGEPKVVPLSGPALEIIRELPRALHSPWLFPSSKTSGEPLRDLKRPWARIRKLAKLPGVRIHDLRRTTGSWLVQKGVHLKVVGAALGHRDSRATEVYARIAASQPAEALEMLGDALAGVVRPRKSRRA